MKLSVLYPVKLYFSSQQQQQPAGSPMSMMTSPSPYIAPSPTPRTTMSVPSPSTALNTPGKWLIVFQKENLYVPSNSQNCNVLGNEDPCSSTG